MKESTETRRPNYGIDAPGLVRGMFTIGVVLGIAAIGMAFAPWPGATLRAMALAAFGFGSAYTLGLAAFMVYYSRFEKLRDRNRLLALHKWTGSESVLDVGCGRGLMMTGAAKRLTTGRATGIDIWSETDQSGNRPEAALENAAIEGVADRVAVETGDMKNLPFPDGSFDMVLSHWAVHNLEDAADRRRTLAEMYRVLRGPGTLILADIGNHAEYASNLRELGFAEIRDVGSRWKFALGTAVSLGHFRPWALVARKPGV